MTEFKTKLLLMAVAAFQIFAASSAAQPVVNSYDHFTTRFAPHSIPGGLPVGDKVQVAAVLDSSDPVGSPTISVQAVQGDTTLTLDYVGPGHPLFQGLHIYYKFIDFDPDLLGPWKIIPTDSTGNGSATFTNAIAEPKFLPFVNNITVQGTPLGSRVAWTLPDLDGFDVDGMGIRIIEAASGSHVSQRVLPVQTTAYEPPAGILQFGVDYVYNIILSDDESFGHENASWAFSGPFRYTLAGDFNTDGTVNAADYTIWRNGLGTVYTQNDYEVWRAHFGQTAFSGAADLLSQVPASAASLSAVVPEPATVCLLIVCILGVMLARATGGIQRR